MEKKGEGGGMDDRKKITEREKQVENKLRD